MLLPHRHKQKESFIDFVYIILPLESENNRSTSSTSSLVFFVKAHRDQHMRRVEIILTQFLKDDSRSCLPFAVYLRLLAPFEMCKRLGLLSSSDLLLTSAHLSSERCLFCTSEQPIHTASASVA